MRKHLTEPRRLMAIVAALALVVTSVLGFRSMRGEEEPDVYAEFTDASPLIVGNDVKVSGVTVGQVKSIEVVDGHALVGMSVEDDALPLHQDARAAVRPVSLLGERFVELDRGSVEAPRMQAGGTIAIGRTGSAVDLDQVLNALDEPTGQALAAFLTTVGHGMNGRGQKIDGAIKALQPAMSDTGDLVAILDQQSDVLAQLVTDLEPLAGAAATDNGQQLDKLLGAADRLLQATSDGQRDLDGTLAQLPGTLHTGRETLRVLRGAADSSTPMLKGMRPTTEVLSELSRELAAFTAQGVPALEALEPMLGQARTLLAAAGPVAASMRASSADLVETAHGLRPVALKLIGNLRNVLDFAKYWALTTNNGDGLSNYFRSHAVVTTEAVTGLLPADDPDDDTNPLGGLDETLDNTLGGLLGGKGLGGLTQSLPGLPGLPGSAGIGRGASADASAPRLGNLTGLTPQQEQSMVTYLLGGSR